jgi:NitT/TauT family transport system permease protein
MQKREKEVAGQTATTPVLDNERRFANWFIPNKRQSPTFFATVFAFWVSAFIFVWASMPASFLPTPTDVLKVIPSVWSDQGLGEQLWVSFTLNWEAVTIMFFVSYLIALSTVIPFFKPLGVIVSSGRFNGFVGMPLIFMALFHNPHWVKVSLLVFGMGVFTVLSLVKMIQSIPKEAYDHSRTLRMSEWRVVWEVVVLGTFDQVIDIMRINIAMGWMMLPMVEGMFKFEGGVGAMMENNAKHFDMPSVFCVVFVVLFVGLVQDYLVGIVKNIVCSYSELGLERG